MRIKGTQIHHLIEQRLWKQNPVLQKLFRRLDDIPGVRLPREVHQGLTNAWRQFFPRVNQAGHIAKPTLDQIISAANQIYAQHPELLKAILVRLLIP